MELGGQQTINKNLPLDVLRSFITIAETGGFTQAGELLNKSQPAMSLQIQRLEKLIGHSVFIRQGRKMTLSPAGKDLYSYAEQIVRLNDEALSQFLKPPIHGKIHFGIPSEFATTLLPKVIGRFTKAYPHVRLEVSSDLSKNLLQETGSNKFDLILALNNDPDKLSRTQVKVDDLVWVGNKEGHYPSNNKTVSLIAAPDGCIYRQRAIKMLDKMRQPWRIVYTIPDLTGIQAAIEAGLGVTVLANSTVPDSLSIIEPSEQLPILGPIGINLIYDKHHAEEATIRLAEFVKMSLVQM